MSNKVFESIGNDIGKLVQQKNAAYGDSFSKSQKILEILYPDGVKVTEYQDMLTLVRVIDKLFRIATKKDALGEKGRELPWHMRAEKCRANFQKTVRNKLKKMNKIDGKWKK